jgi:hypothetical protein
MSYSHFHCLTRQQHRKRVALALIIASIGLASSTIAQDALEGTQEPSEDQSVLPAAMWQPTPLLEPRINTLQDRSTSQSTRSPLSVPSAFDRLATPRSAEKTVFPARDQVQGGESLPLSATDVGNLLKKSSSASSANVQSKTPIISEPHIRGSRSGALAASGSHWVPARADLDTILSKFDSRQIASVDIVPGPYSVRYGPGFSFSDVQLVGSPRYSDGSQLHGATDAEYRVNGNQYFAQQSVLWGGADRGARFNYAVREGDDYRGGGRVPIPSSYRSKEMLLSVGRDFENQSLEVGALYLDQSDLVFPGYVFDIDALTTQGYTVRHAYRDSDLWDQIDTEFWYNETRFDGNAQNPAKRPFFPLLDLASYVGFTDVDSMSTGYRQGYSIGSFDNDGFQWTVGHDLRFVKQELNEISSGVTLGLPIPYQDRNSPIPRSFQANPGAFMDFRQEISDTSLWKSGARADYTGADIVADPSQLSNIGLGVFPASYRNIVGTDDYQRDFFMFSGFIGAEKQLSDEWGASCNVGYAQRPPTLTELYAAQPFMLMLQNGLNNLTGDPTLAKEQLIQFDVGIEYKSDRLRTGWRGFHSWAFDYITYENTRVLLIPPDGDVGQVSLRYVNTDLATFLGTEWFGEFNPDSPFTPFASLRVVDGRDRTRNGRFATSNGNAFQSSEKVSGLNRGAFSGINGSEEEPLPGIPPLEGRIGWRIHDTSPQQRWNIEVSGRLVNGQTRIATSLLETATPGFSVWDTRSVFLVPNTRGMVVALGVENMFDRSYREHFDFRNQNGLGILQPGANFYISTSLNY